MVKWLRSAIFTVIPLIWMAFPAWAGEALEPRGGFVTIDGARYACISDVDAMAPFFMTIVSASDVWLFAGSNGPFTAGRGRADQQDDPTEAANRRRQGLGPSPWIPPGHRLSMANRRGRPERYR